MRCNATAPTGDATALLRRYLHSYCVHLGALHFLGRRENAALVTARNSTDVDLTVCSHIGTCDVHIQNKNSAEVAYAPTFGKSNQMTKKYCDPSKQT